MVRHVERIATAPVHRRAVPSVQAQAAVGRARLARQNSARLSCGLHSHTAARHLHVHHVVFGPAQLVALLAGLLVLEDDRRVRSALDAQMHSFRLEAQLHAELVRERHLEAVLH